MFSRHILRLVSEMTGLGWTKPAASAVTGQQRDVTDWYQTVSADVVWYKMIPDSICYRPLNVPGN